jgi:hypothetical protein
MKKQTNKLNWVFSKGRNSNKKKTHMNKCSPSLVIKKMKIKTTLRFYLTPVLATIKNTTNRCWQGCGKKGTPIHC